MADLIAWAVTLARGEYVWKAEGSDYWSREVARFFDNLATLDRELASNAVDFSIEKMIQGPLADALTHDQAVVAERDANHSGAFTTRTGRLVCPSTSREVVTCTVSETRWE